MSSLPQRQQTGLARAGVVTLLAALWLSLFCNTCLAFAGIDSAPDSGTAGHCQQDEIVNNDGGDGVCDGHCGSDLYPLQSNLPAGLAASRLPDREPVPAVPAVAPATVLALQRTPPESYARPSRSYSLPFQRYTVLLN